MNPVDTASMTIPQQVAIHGARIDNLKERVEGIDDKLDRLQNLLLCGMAISAGTLLMLLIR